MPHEEEPTTEGRSIELSNAEWELILHALGTMVDEGIRPKEGEALETKIVGKLGK